MKTLTKLTTAMALVASGAMAQDETQPTESDFFQNAAENCAPVNNAVINDGEVELEQAISCAEAIAGYTSHANDAIKSHITGMPDSFTKGVYAGTQARCQSGIATFNSAGHKNDGQNPTLEERRVRATHLNELSYACLAFSLGNINGEIAENTGTVVLPKSNVQTIVDTAYCAADVLGASGWTSEYDNKAACKAAKPKF